MDHSIKGRGSIGAKALVLILIVVVWVCLDRLSKAAFAGMNPGEGFGTLIPGVLDIVLVRNTGAAWGILANNTMALGWVALGVCVLLVIYFVVARASISWLQCVAMGLIIGGGIGNAIDRLTQGYVTDFLATTFIDFPVFNVADIGVTCGVILFIIGSFMAARKGDGSQGSDPSSHRTPNEDEEVRP